MDIQVPSVFDFFLIQRVVKAVSTVPSWESWGLAIVLLFLYTMIALPLGFKFNFIRFQPVTSLKLSGTILITCILTPAITEELFFRVLLIPHPSETPNFWIVGFWGLISLILFIIYHPLNAQTFYPPGLKVFFHPIFLTLAAILGIICSISYYQSGSIWTAAFIHWVIVVVWLLVLGGYGKLYDRI